MGGSDRIGGCRNDPLNYQLGGRQIKKFLYFEIFVLGLLMSSILALP